jgi:hypothetical protein
MEDAFSVTSNPDSVTSNPETRAKRYHQAAAEYADRAKDTSSPFLRAFFRHVAEEYLVRADGELRVLNRQKQIHSPAQ